MGLSKKTEREYAKILFINEGLDAKAIAEKVNVRPNTISKWAEEGNWKSLKTSLLTTRKNSLSHWYNQLEAVNEDIANRPGKMTEKGEIERPERKGIPTKSEADVMTQIRNNIKSLETELTLGECIELSMQIISFVQDIDFEHSKILKDYFDEFIMTKVKKK